MRSYALSASNKDGYRVKLLEVPALRLAAETVAYHICNSTRQRWCEHLCGKTAKWVDDGTKTTGSVQISADKLKELDREFWSIFEEEDE